MNYLQAMEQLALAKALETQAKTLKDEVTASLIPIMQSKGIPNYCADDGRKIIYIGPSQTRRLNADQAKAGLVSRGVPVSVITESFEAATITNSRKAYLKYQEPKLKPEMKGMK